MEFLFPYIGPFGNRDNVTRIQGWASIGWRMRRAVGHISKKGLDIKLFHDISREACRGHARVICSKRVSAVLTQHRDHFSALTRLKNRSQQRRVAKLVPCIDLRPASYQ